MDLIRYDKPADCILQGYAWYNSSEKKIEHADGGLYSYYEPCKLEHKGALTVYFRWMRHQQKNDCGRGGYLLYPVGRRRLDVCACKRRNGRVFTCDANVRKAAVLTKVHKICSTHL